MSGVLRFRTREGVEVSAIRWRADGTGSYEEARRAVRGQVPDRLDERETPDEVRPWSCLAIEQPGMRSAWYDQPHWVRVYDDDVIVVTQSAGTAVIPGSVFDALFVEAPEVSECVVSTDGGRVLYRTTVEDERRDPG